MQNTVHVARLDTLQRQGRNERRPDAAPVLGSQDLDGIFRTGVTLFRPVEDLAERQRTASLKMWVFVENRAVGTHMARVITLLPADSSNSAGREAGGTCADKFGCATDQLQLRAV